MTVVGARVPPKYLGNFRERCGVLNVSSLVPLSHGGLVQSQPAAWIDVMAKTRDTAPSLRLLRSSL